MNISILRLATSRGFGSRQFPAVSFSYPHNRRFAVSAHSNNHDDNISVCVPCGPSYWENCHVTASMFAGGREILKRELLKMLRTIEV